MPKSLSAELRAGDEWLRRRKVDILRKCRSLSIVSLSPDDDAFFSSSMAFAGRVHRVIPNSIDDHLFVRNGGDLIRREFGISSSEKVLVFVAQHLSEKRKGFHHLVEALSRLKIDGVTVLCVGHPPIPETATCAKFIPVGFVEDAARLAKIFSASDLFVSPSMAETFGKTTTEALACGVPVVTYPNSGAKFIVGPEDGILCDDFTPLALGHAIQMALSRSFDREGLRRRVLSRFSRDRVATAYLELYREILDQRQAK